MKICWDNLEDIKITRKGNFIKGAKSPMVYMEACDNCGEPYLAYKQYMSSCCCKSCSKMGKKNPAFGKEVSEETRQKHSVANKGKVRSEETRNKISLARKGRFKGARCNSWKGGVIKNGLPLYTTYAQQISFADRVRKCINDKGIVLMEVNCSKCGGWFIPSINEVNNRIAALNGRKRGESRLYCSQKCKDNCEVYGKVAEHYIDIKNNSERIYTSNELNIWSTEVLERANNKCEICGKSAEHAHHIQPKKLEPGFALDPENGFAVCEKCHYKYGHSEECSTNKLARITCNK